MCLHNAVTTKWIVIWIDILQPWTIFRGSLFARMHYAVGANVVILEEVILEIFGEILESCLGVCKIGITSVPFGRKFMRIEKTKACSPRIEARVDMENTVALDRVRKSLLH